ncbi:MAG TPA: EamA family transporter RarD [Chloroflexi bacterium]|nr:EamA family transporter RarD [Chloroflexota bacterium]
MKKGVLLALGAYFIWGVFPLYWKQIKQVPSTEILAHRVVWSFVFMTITLAWRGEWTSLWAALREPAVRRTSLLAGGLLAGNWVTYIGAVNSGYVVEASLGYFINPLVSVLLGVLFLKERLRRGQTAAVLLALGGVLYLTFGYGTLPWIALLLAGTFGLYGLVKKTSLLDAPKGLTAEMMALFVPALGYLLFLEARGRAAFGHQDARTTAMLAFAGVVTAVPLMMFGAGARRIPLSMVGFLQYLAPTMQFLIGVLVYGEPFPLERLLGFSLVWLGLLVYVLEGWWHMAGAGGRTVLSPGD